MCNHDPLYTTDGRCCKCYPPKRVVMVQHVDQTVEVNPAWIVAQSVTLPEAQAQADAKMAEYAEYKLTHMSGPTDPINQALYEACNEHNVKAFEWRRTHPDWRTRR